MMNEADHQDHFMVSAMEKGLKSEGLCLDSLQDPADRFTLGEILGSGIDATVYSAKDNEAGKNVAVKVVKISSENFYDVEEEYKILRDLSSHPNLPDFYGAYRKVEGDGEHIWFIMQLCEGGPVTDLVRALLRQNKKMIEEHIAFILKETLKALIFLHENHVMHRDVKGSNVLLTKQGEVKLVDFGLSRELASSLGKRQTSIGSPCWMAPELVTSNQKNGSYDNRVDVWALGITAIELGDGKAPFQDMHPTRALFHIVRNPPPTLYRPANWTQNYNDFIAECLVKTPEHRPYMAELIEHPFLSELPENDSHLNVELKSLIDGVTSVDKADRKLEVKVKNGLLKKNKNESGKPMHVEDLAALDSINEDTIIQHLEARYAKGQCYTFVGDVLLFLNPNEEKDAYGFQYYSKYKFKSRSDNEPHIYAVADSAYQDMLHHNAPQHIILSGETMSGKTSQHKHLLRHLIYLGISNNKCGEKLQKSLDLIHAFGNAATPIHNDSTRHALITEVTFSNSGKVSGGIFWLYQLEKWRVTGNRSPHHANFHIFYYMYDGLVADDILDRYGLEEKSYCYLRRNIDDTDKDPKIPNGPREGLDTNVDWFNKIKKILTDLGFEENEKDVIWRTLAGILLLGEVEYSDEEDGNADIKDPSQVEKVAEAFSIDSKRLSWALCNYCVLEKDTVARRRHSRPEAFEARNVLAQAIYARLVDWIVNMVNQKLSLTRAVYGDKHCISLVDLFGFECYPDNGLEQLFVNSINEQLQYFYNQKVFISEMQEEEEDEVQIKKLQFYDNRDTMDELLNKPNGIMHILDEANKLRLDVDFVIEWLKKKKKDTNHVQASGDEQFSVAHYTGKINYEAVTMCSKNRDFLPPEITEVMRLSSDPVIKQMFTNKLSRTGNVTLLVDSSVGIVTETKRKRWGAALLADTSRNIRRYNTASRGEFSQTRGIRTAAAVFRATSLEVLRHLSTGGTHFVRCLRTNLNSSPGNFQQNIIKQQLRALAVIDTARARQMGFSHRIPFDQFLERYQFLAFDFDETVEHTKENCRLLMVRLKMEGWKMGNNKIFLKYYNEEFLSRLYETQVKKIIKVQCMLRTFLAKRNIAQKKKSTDRQNTEPVPRKDMSQDSAAVIIQKHMKGYSARRKYGPLFNSATGKLNNQTAEFIRGYFNRWKAKSVFQILLLYRAVKHQQLVYFSQQVHLYSQNVVSTLQSLDSEKVDLDTIEPDTEEDTFIGQEIPVVWKLPFSIKELPFCESSRLCGSVYERPTEELPWDDPFKCLNKGVQTTSSRGESYETLRKKKKKFENFVQTPFTRNENEIDKIYGRQDFPDDDLGQDYVERNSSSRGSMNQTNKYNSSQKLYQNPEGNRRGSNSQGTYKKSEMRMGKVDPKQQYIPKFDLLAKKEESVEIENGSANFRKVLRPTKPTNRPNPIFTELKAKGKEFSSSNTTNEDDPPFNFQAMLKKTNHNRFETKENFNGNDNNRFYNENVVNNNAVYNHKKNQNMNRLNRKKSGNSENQIKSFIRKDSFESIRVMVSSAKDFHNGTIYENGDVAKTEILPGFVVYGECTDL